MKPSVVIYTDGGCNTKTRLGANGMVIHNGQHCMMAQEVVEDTTNNRMELQAVINAICSLQVYCDIDLYSDSKYVVNGYSKGWVYNWQNNGWITSTGNPVKNIDLWEKFIHIIYGHTLRLHWVKGHSDSSGNCAADELCTEAMLLHRTSDIR